MKEELAIVAELAIEFWKLLRSYERALEYIPIEHVAKIQAQLRFSTGRLESQIRDAGLSLVVFKGAYTANLPATAVNGDDFDDMEGAPLIERTIEPAVVVQSDMRVLRMGKVWLVKGSSDVSRH